MDAKSSISCWNEQGFFAFTVSMRRTFNLRMPWYRRQLSSFGTSALQPMIPWLSPAAASENLVSEIRLAE